MSILVLNAGSSSLRFALFSEEKKLIYKGHIDAIGQKHCHFRKYLIEGGEKVKKIRVINHEQAIAYSLKRLVKDGVIQDLNQIKKVGHRVVHGGEHFTKPIKLTMLTLRKLEKLSKLAPLHNPANLSAVKASKKLLKKAIHFAVFDTAFHNTIPQKAFLYGLPYKLYKKEGIRRYGFHGTSHAFVGREASKLLKKKNCKLITCHIGNGVSLTAIKNGLSIDTSMGFTPLEGPMMGTRSGTIDPAIIFHLIGKGGKPDKIHNMLEHESGFKGMSEIGSDIRKLRAKSKSKGTIRTFELFSYQMAKIIFSYFATLEGPPDAIIFTAGIGENAHYLREQICEYLKAFGVELDKKENLKNATIISSKKSKIKIIVIKTDEELEIVNNLLSL